MPAEADRARLFTAVLPSEEAIAALRAELRRHPRTGGDRALRWTTAAQWHITLGFYGTDEPARRVDWLRPRLAGLFAPTLWLQGAGSFRGVLWAGVGGDPGDHLGALAAAVRPADDERDFHAHLTLARGHARAAIERWRRMLAGFRGPAWTATEVVLLRSEPGAPDACGEGGRAGPRYVPVERFRLDAPG